MRSGHRQFKVWHSKQEPDVSSRLHDHAATVKWKVDHLNNINAISVQEVAVLHLVLVLGSFQCLDS